MPSVDELFTVTPERFVASRDEMVRELRAAGDRDAATRIKALRRPSPAAWALNQLVRRERERVEAVLAAGAELRAAQRRAMSGVKDSGFREASTRRRQLVQELTKVAAGILAELGRGGGAGEEIARSLEAASIDEAAGASLLEGRLTREIEASSGFEAVQGLGVVADAQDGEELNDTEREALEVAARNAERQATDAEAEARRAAMRAEALERQADEVAARATEARAEAQRLEAASEDARKRLEAARAELTTG